MIKRDIPRWSELKLPENPESWYNVYQELLEKSSREVEEDAQRMELALQGIYDRKGHTSLVDPSKLPPPKRRRAAGGLNSSKISKKSPLNFLRDKSLKKLSVPTHLLNKGFVPGRGTKQQLPELDTSRKGLAQNAAPRTNASSLVRGTPTTSHASRLSPNLTGQTPMTFPQRPTPSVSRVPQSQSHPDRSVKTASPKPTAMPLSPSLKSSQSKMGSKPKPAYASSATSPKTLSSQSKIPTRPVASDSSRPSDLKHTGPLPSSSSASRQKLPASPSKLTKSGSSKTSALHAHQTGIRKQKRADDQGAPKPGPSSKPQPSSGALLANLIQSDGHGKKSQKMSSVAKKPTANR